jgi:hypothetical protein
MKHAYIGMILLMIGAVAPAQQQGDSTEIAPGFSVRPNGILDIGDITAEVYHFNPAWTITEQHDVFKPEDKSPATQPSVHVISGAFPTASGPSTLTETFTPADSGISYSATISSDKPLETNELSVSFSLPVKSFGGKQITVDGESVTLPADPAKKGEPRIFDKDSAQKIELPTAAGTLVITGNLSFLLQDDREFGDQRYALRLHFTPGDGQITQSKIEFQLKSQKQ